MSSRGMTNDMIEALFVHDTAIARVCSILLRNGGRRHSGLSSVTSH